MTTSNFNTAHDAKHLSLAQFSIISINGIDVSKSLVNISNKHITSEGFKGIQVFEEPYKIEFKKNY